MNSRKLLTKEKGLREVDFDSELGKKANILNSVWFAAFPFTCHNCSSSASLVCYDSD